MTLHEAHSADRRPRVLKLVSRAALAGDDEAIAAAIRGLPVGVLSRWERALLSLIPTVNAVNTLMIQARVEIGIREESEFREVLGEVGWMLSMIDRAVINVRELPAFDAWGPPDERDSAPVEGSVSA